MTSDLLNCAHTVKLLHKPINGGVQSVSRLVKKKNAEREACLQRVWRLSNPYLNTPPEHLFYLVVSEFNILHMDLYLSAIFFEPDESITKPEMGYAHPNS